MKKAQKTEEVVDSKSKTDSSRETTIDYTRRSPSATVFSPLTGRKRIN